MDWNRARQRLEGCYITVPTMFRDPDLELDLAATRRAVAFLIERGVTASKASLLAGRGGGGKQAPNAPLLRGAAAGVFTAMTFDERLAVAEAVIGETAGRIPVAMG